LQLHQLALETQQFLEIKMPIEGFPFGRLADLRPQPAQSAVVELHLDFFVDVVHHFAMDAILQRVSRNWVGLVHD
jgi:hypothetical protein